MDWLKVTRLRGVKAGFGRLETWGETEDLLVIQVAFRGVLWADDVRE
jgi:hypothetical protein